MTLDKIRKILLLGNHSFHHIPRHICQAEITATEVICQLRMANDYYWVEIRFINKY